MARPLFLDHVDAKLFRQWEASQTTPAQRQYVSEVARFLRDNSRKPLSHFDVHLIAAYLENKPPRAMTALSHFFQFLLERGVLRINPVEKLKYRRRIRVSDLQLDFFDQLVAAGIEPTVVRKLCWRDFVAPIIVSRRRGTVRVGQDSVAVHGSLWSQLEARFKQVLKGDDLIAVLHAKIAS